MSFGLFLSNRQVILKTLLERIQDRSARVSIIGLGYVGLPLSFVFNRAGYDVLGMDIDREKTQALNAGESYIRHIGSQSVREALASGRFAASSNYDDLHQCDAIIICVPTPLDRNRQPDISYIEKTGCEIAARLHPNQLIVLESSTYPGTTEEVLIPQLEASGVPCTAATAHMHHPAAEAAAAGVRAFVAYSPEREDPGNQKFTTAAIPKLVGGVDEEAGELAAALYGLAFEKVVRVSSARMAEMAKILENTYRCVNIAMINELNQLCLRMGLDICEVIDAASTKPFGFQAFYPGPGLGGHCIPIDPYYLSWKARQYDFTTRFIELAGEINTEIPYKVVHAVSQALNDRGLPVKGSQILVLGVAYKKDIDDLRESPALKLIDLLRQMGARVEYNDPLIPHVPSTRHYSYEMHSVPFEPVDAAQYDCLLIATDHSRYNFLEIARHARLLLDTRNATRGIKQKNVIRI